MAMAAQANIKSSEDEDLSLSLEIIESDDWDGNDSWTLASSFCSISGDTLNDLDARLESNSTLVPATPTTPRIPTPPPLPERLPVEPWRKPVPGMECKSADKLGTWQPEMGNGPELVYPPPPALDQAPPPGLGLGGSTLLSAHEIQWADIDRAKMIRKHFLAREKERKALADACRGLTPRQPPPTSPTAFQNLVVLPVQNGRHPMISSLEEEEEAMQLLRRAMVLDIDVVVSMLERGVRPVLSERDDDDDGDLQSEAEESPPPNKSSFGFLGAVFAASGNGSTSGTRTSSYKRPRPPLARYPMGHHEWHQYHSTNYPQATAEMLRLLVAEGMDPDFPRMFGLTPLCSAVESDRDDLVEWLLGRGANPNAEGVVQKKLASRIEGDVVVGYHLTALDYAVVLGKRKCAKLLASVSGIDTTGHRFYTTCRRSGHPPLIPIDPITGRVDYTTDRKIVAGVSALHFADTYTASLIIGAGASLHGVRDSLGRSPLHWAAAEGDVARTLFLLGCAAGCAVDGEDAEGATALALVCAANERGVKAPGFPEVVRLLLLHRADSERKYPQDLSIRTRFWMMPDWRAAYEPVFEEFGLLEKCRAEEVERMARWTSSVRSEEGRAALMCGGETN